MSDEINAEFTPEDLELAARLAAGDLQAQAAEACGTSRSTVQRRLRNLKFRELVAGLRRERHEAAAGVLISAAAAAAKELDGLTRAAGPHDATRVSACRTLLLMALQYESVTDIQRQMDELRAELIRGGIVKYDGTGPLPPPEQPDSPAIVAEAEPDQAEAGEQPEPPAEDVALLFGKESAAFESAFR